MKAERSTSSHRKLRLDLALLRYGLAETQQRAQAVIMTGQVRVNGQPADKPGQMISDDAGITIVGERSKYASRAGLKLEGALEDFHVSATDAVCLDIGASNGGFTDCLLGHGARLVYAIDVNTAQLDWKLRQDSRVASIKKNARYLKPNEIAEAADLITIDVSFISATKILRPAAGNARSGATFLILVKPQFELPRGLVGEGGIVREAAMREKATRIVCEAAEAAGLAVLGVKPSRIAGAEGNQEYFLHARRCR